MTERKSVEIGQRWTVKLHGTLTVVRITDIRIVDGYYSQTTGRTAPVRWRASAINEMTGRAITIKSATKLRALVPAPVTPEAR